MTSLKGNRNVLGIFLCFCRIQHYIQGTTESELLKDLKTCDAINYNLHCIGNLISKLPKDFKAKYKEIPWVWLELYKDDFYWSDEDIWSTVYDEGVGISTFFDQIAEIFRRECPEDAPKFFKQVEKNEVGKTVLPFDTNYKYAIHTKASLWTVKKR